MAEEEDLYLDFTKLNIDIRRPSKCLQPKDPDTGEEQVLHRLTFSGEVCSRKSCQCNNVKRVSPSENSNNWSRRVGQTRCIIHRARLTLCRKHSPILRSPTLQVNHNKQLSKRFLKLDKDQLLKDNVSLVKMSPAVLKTRTFINNKSKTVIDFKSLSVSDTPISSATSFGNTSFKIYRDARLADVDGLTSTSQQQSCSQQARIVREDITINELAGYFENLVHIPKKMSHMAEQMYT